jgi:hypothetical protein
VLSRFALNSVAVSCLTLTVFGVGFCLAQQPIPANIGSHQQTIQQIRDIAQNWRWQAEVQISFVIAVILFGALITIFQGLSKGWCKPATLVLGACTTILTAVNTKVFSADYRVFQQSAIDADVMTDQMTDLVRRENNPTANVDELEAQFLSLTTQFRSLQRAVTLGTAAKSAAGNSPASSASLLDAGIGSVYAQSAVPAWVTQPPSGANSLYVVGIGQDASIASAEQLSINNAVAAAVKQVSSGSNTDVPRLTKFIASASLIENKYFTFDEQRGLYTYYSLLHISDDIKRIDFSAPSTKSQCAHVTLKERTWERLALPGGDGTATLALGDLYRLNRGPDASHLYLLSNSAGYTGSSGKFVTPAKTKPTGLIMEFSFSAPKNFPVFNVGGTAYQLRITGLDHNCLTAGCQSLTLEICLMDD